MPKGSKPMPCSYCGGPRPAKCKVRRLGRDIRACPPCRVKHARLGTIGQGGIPLYLNRAFREARQKPLTISH